MAAEKDQDARRDWRCECGQMTVSGLIAVVGIAPCCGKPLRPV
jgi:hypothetical protein